MPHPLTLSLQAPSPSPVGEAIVVFDDRVLLGDADALPLPHLPLLEPELGCQAPAAPPSPEATYRDRLGGL